MAERSAILAVGLGQDDARSVPGTLFGILADMTRHVELVDLGTTDLSATMVVISPLMGDRADAVEVAEMLDEVGYRGRYMAFAPYLPDRAMIEREVSRAAPGLLLDVIEMSRGPRSLDA